MQRFRLCPVFLLLSIIIAAPARAQTTRILGFGDVSYVATDRNILDGFGVGQLVAHGATGFSDRVAVFAEVSATARSTGYDIEVERLILRYEFSDLLKVSLGRFHTPVSYWNTAYHHGLWLQTTVSRPEYVRFGSRYVPVHFLGVLAEGSIPTSRLGPSYFAGVGNGRGENIARAGDHGDVNGHRAWLAGGYLRPAMIYGLQLGGAIYRDRVSVSEDLAVDETIASAHVIWGKENPEVLAEYALVAHESTEDDTVNHAYYVQVGYRLQGDFRPLKPYIRLEKITSQSRDPVFGPLGLGYEGAIAGVRYDFGALAALKVEYRNEQFEGADRSGSLYAQVSFTFGSAMAGE